VSLTRRGPSITVPAAQRRQGGRQGATDADARQVAELAGRVSATVAALVMLTTYASLGWGDLAGFGGWTLW